MENDTLDDCGKKIISSSINKRRARKVKARSELTILVGIDYFQSLLRTVILLNTMPNYHIDVIYSGKRDISGILCAHITLYRGQEKTEELLEQADLVIGSKVLALKGIIGRKPVVVLGDSGLAGAVTSDTVMSLYRNGFAGRINGELGEYFPLIKLQQEIEKGFAISKKELEIISKKVEKESKMDRKMILKVVSSLC